MVVVAQSKNDTVALEFSQGGREMKQVEPHGFLNGNRHDFNLGFGWGAK
jgi:hypothetical protein